MSFSLSYILIKCFMYFNLTIVCFSFFVCAAFCVLCSVFCVFVLFCVLFYIVVNFLFVYNFADHCHWVETQFQLINMYIISYIIYIISYHISYHITYIISYHIPEILRSAFLVYSHVLCASQNKQRFFFYTALTNWFL